MRRTHAGVMLALSLVVLAGCSTATGSSAAAGLSAAAGIVGTRCTRCHSLDRIRAAQHDAAAWKATVDRMRGKGARLSDAEEQAVIDFLAGGGAAGL